MFEKLKFHNAISMKNLMEMEALFEQIYPHHDDIDTYRSTPSCSLVSGLLCTRHFHVIYIRFFPQLSVHTQCHLG